MAETMTSPPKPNGEALQVSEIHVLWITAGLGCDGDTIAITAATQPSLEDIVLGVIPGIPKVHFHNPVLAYENADDFLQFFYDAADGKLGPFVLVVEGSIPNEKNKDDGFWAAMGTDKETGQPIPTCTWIDRLAPKAWAVVGAGTCAAYGGLRRHSRDGRQPHRLHGAARLSWLGLEVGDWGSHRLRSWLSRASGQLHGNGAVSFATGGRDGSDDSTR